MPGEEQQKGKSDAEGNQMHKKVVYSIIQQPEKRKLLEKAVMENKGKQPEMLCRPILSQSSVSYLVMKRKQLM